MYVVLPPLRPGVHVIHFGGEWNVPATPAPPAPLGPLDFVQDITYTITVTR